MKHHTSRRLAVLTLAAATLGAITLPALALAGAFRVPTTGTNNQLTAGLGTLIWRHDYDVVTFAASPTPHYETLLSGFDWQGFQASAQVGPYFYFSDPTTLWRTEGTLGTTSPVASLPASWEKNVTAMAGLDGTLFFRGYTPETGFEPWVSDGTAPGTRIVKDVYPGPTSGRGGWTAVLGNRVYFDGDDGTNGRELWASNGQEPGTSMVKDINPAGSSSPDSLVACGPHLYFTADDGVNGRSLWRTDGSGAGTLRVTSGVEPIGYDLTCAGGRLFFDAPGDQLWVYDPVDGTQHLLKSDWGCGADAASCGPSLHTFRAVNDALLFAAGDGVHGVELWRSDGTAPGTVMVKDLWPGLDYGAATPSPFSSEPYDMEVKDGRLYFRARHPDFGGEVWVSDGTAANTWPVTDILPGPGNSWPDELTAAGGLIFFRVAGDGASGLWAFDPAATPPYRDVVRDGSFESAATATSWTRLALTAIRDARVCTVRSYERCSFRIVGSRTAAKGLRQTILRGGTRGDAGQLIALSGWSAAKGASASGGFYGLEMLLTYRDGSTAVRRVSFARGTHPWQYRRVQLRAAKPWSRVSVLLRYQNLLGTAWFDDVRLTVR